MEENKFMSAEELRKQQDVIHRTGVEEIIEDILGELKEFISTKEDREYYYNDQDYRVTDEVVQILKELGYGVEKRYYKDERGRETDDPYYLISW